MFLNFAKLHCVSDIMHTQSDKILQYFHPLYTSSHVLSDEKCMHCQLWFRCCKTTFSSLLYLIKKYELSCLNLATIILLASISGHIKSWHSKMIWWSLYTYLTFTSLALYAYYCKLSIIKMISQVTHAWTLRCQGLYVKVGGNAYS